MKKGLLNKSRVSTSIPNDALYGPEDEGGMKLPHIYLTQGLLHLNKCVMFIASNSITGKLLCTSLELCTLEVGIGRSIFSLDYKKFGHLPSKSWIENLWKFTSEYGINIVDRHTQFFHYHHVKVTSLSWKRLNLMVIRRSTYYYSINVESTCRS